MEAYGWNELCVFLMFWDVLGFFGQAGIFPSLLVKART